MPKKISKVKLESFFRQFSAARVSLPKAMGNLYEAFVYLETCAAAKRSRFTVNFVTFAGEFKFRSSPGNIGGTYGYAELTSLGGALYELHNGIEIIGHSGMQHEADILLLSKASQHSTLTANRTQLELTIECKDYASASRLKGEVRKIVGSVTDWAESSHTSRKSSPSKSLQFGCLHCGKRFEALFATSVRKGLRTDIEDFLSAYDITPCFGAFTGAGGMSDLRSSLSKGFGRLP